MSGRSLEDRKELQLELEKEQLLAVQSDKGLVLWMELAKE